MCALYAVLEVTATLVQCAPPGTSASYLQQKLLSTVSSFFNHFVQRELYMYVYSELQLNERSIKVFMCHVGERGVGGT